jgi:hypothetical protein
MSPSPSAARKILLIPAAERPASADPVRRYRIARVEHPDPREARFAHLKRMYD